MNKRLIASMLAASISLSTISCANTDDKLKEDPVIEETVDNTTPFSIEEKEVVKGPVAEHAILEESTIIPEEEIEPEVIKTSITISAVGDCTLGRDDDYGYQNSLPWVLEQQDNDYSYFFSGVYDILSNDDLTIANLEGPLTDATVKAEKKFTFKGPSDYTNILTEGSVEAVNLANNHTRDYLEQGYQDTLETLEASPLEYFGNGIYSVIEVNGKTIGMAGINGWDVTTACNDIDATMDYFHVCQTDINIFSFHWGIERDYKQNSTQETIARYAVDSGADLVLGHHPHVLQGIEEYNGKYIVYSLGNFVFGGNKNPSDKDTMVFQITFNYEDDELIDTNINIIPASLSSVTDRNDYQPTVLEGEKKEKVLKKVLDSSTNLNYVE